MSGCHTGVAPRSRSAVRAGSKWCKESECLAVGDLRKSLYIGIDVKRLGMTGLFSVVRVLGGMKVCY